MNSSTSKEVVEKPIKVNSTIKNENNYTNEIKNMNSKYFKIKINQINFIKANFIKNTKKSFKKTSKNSKNEEHKNEIKNKKIFVSIITLLVTLIIFSFYITHFIQSSKISELPKIIKTKIKRLLSLTNDYNSFAYKKSSNYCQYFVDGKNYFEDLFQNLMNAKETIFIAGFWLSPELFLRRPVDENIYIEMAKNGELTKDLGNKISRLMDVLDYKAKQGVKIYILIYYEWGATISVNSKFVENLFKKLNNDIIVVRFPIKQKVLLWVNHEKLVIIDKIIGYVGGFDLCWGRYDNNKHTIVEEPNNNNIYEYPLYDYVNDRIEEYSHVDNYIKPIISRTNTPRLPWHDIHCRIIGPSVEDITKHFTERWNFAITSEMQNNGVISNIKNVVDYKSDLSLWEKMKLYFSKKEDKSSKAENILEIDDNINKKLEEEIYVKYKNLGGVSSDVQVLRSVSNWNIDTEKTEDSILKAYIDLIQNSEHYIFIENQFFVSKAWTNEEKSKVDENKKRSSREIVKNEIALYIRRRIEKAYDNKENFKVYIVIPLLPDYTGEVEDSPTLLTILKYTYRTIFRNNGLSLIEQLQKKMGDKWKNYICFYSLRNHGIINGIPKTEMIYIHSKLLIVDDTKVVLGSANLNDRSMLGNRDSEVDVLIEEQREDFFLMNGDPEYKAAKFALGLRKKLMAEYLGIDIDNSILDDPVSDDLFKFMKRRAKKNTELYHEIFGCYPDDKYTSFELLKNARKEKREESKEVLLQKYNTYKNSIVGYIVEYPLNFLKDENLGKISGFSIQDLLPETTYT